MAMSFGGVSKAKVATVIVAADGSGDTTDIQTGINLLPDSGGVVYIKEGIYKISSPININKNNVSIKGAGKSTNIQSCGSITIFNCGSYDGILIDSVFLSKYSVGDSKGIVFTSTENSGIFNCWIEGMGVNGIEISTDCINMYIQNTYIKDCGNIGILVVKSSGLSMLSNFISGSAEHNIRLENSSNLTVRGNFTSEAGAIGLLILKSGTGESCSRNVIEDNYIYENNGDGLSIQETPNQYHVIRNNHIYGNGSTGISLTLVDYSILDGNVVVGNQKNGIVLTGSSYNTLKANTVTNNSQSYAGGYSGILLNRESATSTHSDYNIISSNQLDDNQGTPTQAYGYIEQSGNADYNVIIGNVAIGNATGNYSVSGSNDIYVNNQ